MADSKQWYIRTSDGSEYGPTDMNSLVAYARDGRIDADCFVMSNQTEWIPATSLPELGIHWLCKTKEGHFAGPFHKDYVDELIRQKALPSDIQLYQLADPNEKLSDLQGQIDQVQKQLAESRNAVKQLSAKLNAANKERDARTDKIRDLQAQLKDAEQKIKELQKPQKPKNPLLSLFGKDSPVDLSVLEQAAQRELSAMKRPYARRPDIKLTGPDVIDV